MKKYLYTTIAFFLIIQTGKADYWTQKANVPGGGRADGAGFAVGTKGYIGTGYVTGYTKDWYEYDPSTNLWLQKADYGGSPNVESSTFSIDGKGFFLPAPTGNDFWEFDPIANTWTQQAVFPGQQRQAAVSFVINGKGYICSGASSSLGTSLDDLWEYDPALNTWFQRASLTGPARHYAAGFAVGGKGYIGTGYSTVTSGTLSDFWEWDQLTNTWTQKTNFPGGARFEDTGFSIGDYGYMGTGYIPSPDAHIWKYDPVNDAWSPIAPFGGGVRVENVSFSIDSLGYLGTGWDGVNFRNDFWEYHPEDQTSGISEAELTAAQCTIFPNPFVASATVVLNEQLMMHDAQVKLFDATGREAYTQNVSSRTFALTRGNLAAGIYTLCLLNDGKQVLKKKVSIQNL